MSIFCLKNEHRVFGPPGTGKTSFLEKQVKKDVANYGPEGVVVASFTKTAAVEIAGRGLPLPKGHVGTLHAMCYRALGCPKVAEKGTLLEQWNEAAGEFEKIDAEVDDEEDFLPIDRNPGDPTSAYQGYNALRGRMVPRELWPDWVKRFAAKWEAFKRDTGSVDFTDMIELSLARGVGLPRSAEVGFFDEVQDFSPLELKLVRSWGTKLERIILAGDDDQCIYSFKGATPQAFLDPPIPPERKRVLAQSYRLPVAVKNYAERWTAQLARREPKSYRPRLLSDGKHAEGQLSSFPSGFDRPEDLLEEIEAELARRPPVEGVAPVMVLATCGYMLDRLIGKMRSEGIMFHNPYRLSNGRWNPLRSGLEKLKLLLRNDPEVWGFDARPWTWAEMWPWFQTLDTEKANLSRGAKRLVKQFADDPSVRDLIVTEKLFGKLFTTKNTNCPTNFFAPLKWYTPSLISRAYLAKMEYALQIVRHRGTGALVEKPRIVIGTVHSVKGAQAQTVFVSPDLSGAAMSAWTGESGTRDDVDSIARVFYVAFTRARERLVLCEGKRRAGRWVPRRAVEF